MHIPSYQINNVIKVYSKQVSQNRMLERQKNMGLASPASVDKIDISAEGKRQAIVEKVSAEIVDRLTRQGPRTDAEYEIMGRLSSELGEDVELNQGYDGRFVYNMIGEDNEKVTKTLSLDDSDLVGNRLKELVKEAVVQNMEA